MGEQKLSDIPGLHRKSVYLPLVAAGTAKTANPIFVAEEDMEIVSANYFHNSKITGNDVNNFTIGVINKGVAAAKSDIIASKTYDAAASEAISPVNAALTVDATKVVVLKGEMICWFKANAAAGLQMEEGVMEVYFLFKKPPTA